MFTVVHCLYGQVKPNEEERLIKSQPTASFKKIRLATGNNTYLQDSWMSLSWHFYNCLLDRKNLVSEFENSLLTRSYRSSFLSTHFSSSPLVKINAIRSSIKRTASSSKFEMRLALAKFLFNLFALAVTGITFWIMRCFSFSCISEGNILAKIMTYNLNSFILRPLKLYGQLCFSLSAKIWQQFAFIIY